MTLRTLFSFLALLPTVLAAVDPICPNASQAEYDYIVVGSGAGGGPVAARLAENGFSVLVVEVGHDVHTLNTTIPFYFPRAVEDPDLELSYSLDEYPSGFKYQKDDVWYPRSRGIGGSTLHNALINIIASTRSEFDGLASMFNDTSFSRENMQNYFKKIEDVQYPVLNPDHGTKGWLKTSSNPFTTFLNPQFLDLQVTNFAVSALASGPPILDLNSIAGDQAIGVNTPSFTMGENFNRSSVRERLLSVRQSTGKLFFKENTLATRILLCNGTSGKPTAYGVEIAEGATLPVAGNFKGKANLQTTRVLARREVIVSAGVFQSPQLLMLSGIGDREHLSTHGIDSVVHLPGVGKNLQDHDEIAVIWRMKDDFKLFDGCTAKYTREEDPCLKYWADVSKHHPYSFGGAFVALTSKSRDAYPAPDMLTYFSPSYFPGFVRGFSQRLYDNTNTVTAISLKARPSSRGTVRLTGSHPQDVLDIQKLHFQSSDGPRDVEDLRKAIKRSREIMGSLPVALHVDQEIFPGPQAKTDAQIDEHIYKNIFGHHACCTNPMGKENDPNAVLDGEFQVRGVNNLRVVDASSWPVVPGYFVTTPFYMLAEKAADTIIKKAQASL